MDLKIIIIVLGILLVLAAITLIALCYALIHKVKHLKKALSDTQFQKTELEKKLNSEIKKAQMPNLVNIYPEIYNIIAEWCKEAGIYQVAVKTKYDSKLDCYKLTLYTERPGLFIGKAGSLCEKYKKLLQECKACYKIEQLEIQEISGIVNQNQVDVEDYYSSYMANWFAYEEAGEEC